MKTPHWAPVKLDSVDGFYITLSFEEEYTDARSPFITDYGQTDEDSGIIDNQYYWFCVKVSASVGGMEFGSSYLGCNVYKSLKEVIDTKLSGYLPQLIDEAVDDAKANTKYIALVKHFWDN
jgi:hypothetical protein